MNHERSRELYGRALSVLAGGVNSSVRATKPYPFFIERGDGAHVVDADGNRYIDYVMGYGPLLYGHDMPEPVRAAVQSHAADGPMYGAPTEVEVELAEFVARHVPSVEMVRFVNSGTEATVSAVRLARGYTGRDKVVVMQGGYHGAQESTLVEGGPENPRPSTAGIPKSFAEHTIPVPFNDEDGFDEDARDVVAVFLEHRLDGLLVVERHRDGVFGERLGNPRRGGPGVLRPALDERRLLGAVVAALHDDDFVPPRVAAGEPDRRDGRLGSRVHEPDHLHRGDVAGDELRVVDLYLRGRAVHRPLGGVRLDGRPNRVGHVVAVQQRSVPHHVVDVAVAVGVDDVGPVAALDEERVRSGRPDGGVDAAGDYGERPVVQVAGAVVIHALSPPE